MKALTAILSLALATPLPALAEQMVLTWHTSGYIWGDGEVFSKFSDPNGSVNVRFEFDTDIIQDGDGIPYLPAGRTTVTIDGNGAHGVFTGHPLGYDGRMSWWLSDEETLSVFMNFSPVAPWLTENMEVWLNGYSAALPVIDMRKPFSFTDDGRVGLVYRMQGERVGAFLLNNGWSTVTLAPAIPEPPAYLMLLAGLVGMPWLRRRYCAALARA